MTLDTYVEGTITSYNIVQGTNYYIAVACNFTNTSPKFLCQTSLFTSSVNITEMNPNVTPVYLSVIQTGQTAWANFTPSSATKFGTQLLVYAR
jgi:hypothetical protein